MMIPGVEAVARTFGTAPLRSQWIEVRQVDMDGFAEVEVEGGEGPVMVADWLVLFVYAA